MATWAEFSAAAPELSAAVRDRFRDRKHCTMATLRADGSPRISGTEVEFTDDDLVIGVMPDSVKGRDLQRDPRVAIHSPTVDPPDGKPAAWPGEAKIAGLAVAVSADTQAGARYRIELTEAVLTRIADSGKELQITWWRPGEPIRQVLRR